METMKMTIDWATMSVAGDWRGMDLLADTKDCIARGGGGVSSGGLLREVRRRYDALNLCGRESTACNVHAAGRSFHRFLDECGLEEAAPVDARLIEGYALWLERRGVCSNTVSFYMRALRAVFRGMGIACGVAAMNPFATVYTGVAQTRTRSIGVEEISKIKRCDLSRSRAWEHSRDMFMLSFYLRGMNLIDMALVRKEDLRDGVLVYRRHKTGQMLAVRWTDEMQAIVDRYAAADVGRLIPVLQMGAGDIYKAYRNSRVRINRNLREVGRMLELERPLTMYVARHSWASVARGLGVPISLISEGLGHQNERTTRIYLASLDNEALHEVNGKIIGMV